MFKSLKFGLALLALLGFIALVPADTVHAQATAKVAWSLYKDNNGNGYLDWTGYNGVYDSCVREADSTGGWLATNNTTTVGYLVVNYAGDDYLVDSFDDWWECAINDAYTFTVSGNSYYTLTGCGPLTDVVWIGTTSGDQKLAVSHRTNTLEPSC
jgi:hypothetical protein